MITLEDIIGQYAVRCADRLAVVSDDGEYSYARLYDAVCRQAVLLSQQKESAVVFRASQTADFVVTYLAAHLAGRVAVPLEKDVPDNTFEAVRQIVNTAPLPADTYDILFTTGTTGRQKGVMVSRRATMANIENLHGAQPFAEDLTFIISGPLNHIGSLSKLQTTLAVGGTVRLFDGLRDLASFYRAISDAPSKVATFQVPASLRMLMRLSGKDLAHVADRIAFIETGAAAIAQSDMEQLCSLLPHSRLFNTYASTETGIIATYDYNNGDSNDGGCVAGCLGRPMCHSRIIITGEGRICCQGETLMSGYVGDEEMTKSVLTDDGLLTSDVGRLDGEGRLHLTGRSDDIINIGGYKIDPTEVEAAALAHPSVADCICVAVSHPIMGSVLQLLVVPSQGITLDKRKLAQWLKARLEAYKVPQLYEQTDHVERTFNGKPNRKRYSIRN